MALHTPCQWVIVVRLVSPREGNLTESQKMKSGREREKEVRKGPYRETEKETDVEESENTNNVSLTRGGLCGI